MAIKRDANNTTREEDYRDYDTRNIDDGWPYADAAGGATKPVGNAAYGDPNANFDRDRNRGYHVEGVDEEGLEERTPDSVLPATDGFEESDDVEERVTEALDNLGDVPMASIDVHAERGTVTIEGVVDDSETSSRVMRTAQSISGVLRVVNNLRLAGVDTHIPQDD
ncbi:BON domain-containing protein [Rhizobium halophilum]|uniref:BON domain-containing protein n=1 Tax=Rhizobium halophilum TaxID=2846852 RepID=UPI001EFEB35D|nr:BON domain-containing protein [Rhizobium halophilum]MCF6368479.1 BON domain-containing protein [Rhizobium halophilum]